MAKKRKAVKKRKKQKKEVQSQDIIFDSSVGKTDALFVSNPDNQREINNLMEELEARLSAKEKAGFQKQIIGETPTNIVNPPEANFGLPKILAKRKGAFSWRKFFLLE